MIIAHIEIWPGGDGRRAKRIATVHASRAAHFDASPVADYEISLIDGQTTWGHRRKGEIKNFRRDRGAAALIREALDVLLTDEEKRR